MTCNFDIDELISNAGALAGKQEKGEFLRKGAGNIAPFSFAFVLFQI